MSDIQDVRLAHYQIAREALLEHAQRTEDGVRAIIGMDDASRDQLLVAIQEKHDRLLSRIERKIQTEARTGA
jgi:hypothetical protein